MIRITSVRVTGFSRRYFDVDWQIAPTNDDLQEWEFFVERSEAEAGPWHIVAGPLIDRYYLRDNTTPQISINRTLFYRVRAVNPLRSVEIVSKVVDREGGEDLIAAEIISLESMLFQEFIGTIAWLFPRRTFGQRCPQCWDSVLGKRIDDSCPVCFGTGFSGGYHYPIEFYPQFDKAPRVDQVATHDHHQQTILGMRCQASPRLSPFDLLIDHKNQRYRVISAASTSRLGVDVHQEAQVIVLQPGSIEDAIELKVDHRNLRVAGYRNFSNPQCPEEANLTDEDALPGILGPYGYR